MSQLVLNPWQIEEEAFPVKGTPTEKLKFLLNYAVLAPSEHNLQPWLFQIADDAVELYADRTRVLPVVAPDNRELIFSCGVALYHLCIAIRHFGYGDVVEIFPNHEYPNLLARIRIGSKRIVLAEEHFLFRAIQKRRTNRLSFTPQKIPSSLLSQLQTAASREHASLEVIDNETCQALAKLIAQGECLKMADPQFRRELAAWISFTPNSIPKRLNSINSLLATIIHTFERGKSQSAKDKQLAENLPVLAVLKTDLDTPKDWLKAGQALGRVLLQSRIDDVCTSFLSQPIAIPWLRTHLCRLLKSEGYPQILLCMSYDTDTKPTSRRVFN